MGFFFSDSSTYGGKSKNTDVRIAHFYDRYPLQDLMEFLEKEQIQSYQIIDIKVNYIDSKHESVVDLIYKTK